MKTNKKIPLILAVSLLILMGTVGCVGGYKSNVILNISGDSKMSGKVDALSEIEPYTTTTIPVKLK